MKTKIQFNRISGVSPFTQAGFELAKAGLWKPRDHTLPPIVYGLKLVNFKPPFFDVGMCRKFIEIESFLFIICLDIHLINEEEIHLKELLVDIGVRLRTSALSESIRRTGIGPLTIQHSLVIDEITPETLINNINTVEELIAKLNMLDKTALVNKSYKQEIKLLGKQSDESSIDLYKTKRPMNRQSSRSILNDDTI